jgi:predicted regulator of Ras-like GTPase activity (Roadblock/LC7/MglB family)
MGFSEQLKEMVASVDGAVACSVMGFDGIAVETHNAEIAMAQTADLELSNAWVEYSNLLQQLKKAAAENLKTGPISELSVNTEKVLTVMRMVNQDYFVVMGLLPTGNYGKARYVLRLGAPKLAKELV